MDIAGLVIGVVTAWETSVQIFDIVHAGRKYGMDYELLHVKLEVERIRLLTWGEAVGLSAVDHGQPSPDARLNRADMRAVIIRLLGCIQHVFSQSERLQEIYGLSPMTPPDHQEGEYPPTQTQFILGPIFKRAYESLRRSAKDRQGTASLPRKTIWVIQDKKKFQTLVDEIRGFNDSLEALFPDVASKAATLIRNDIDMSVEVRELQVLQQATADGHEEISETASIRIETLGGTARTVTEAELVSPQVTEALADQVKSARIGDNDTNELDRQLKDLETFIQTRNHGALTLSLLGPDRYLARVSAHVYWDGQHEREPFWAFEDREMGYTKLSHPSFDLYRRKKFIDRPSRDGYESPSDADYVLLDVEADARYENVHPGTHCIPYFPENAVTVTVAGFGLECWDYEEKFGKPRDNTILVNCSEMPNIPARKLLRRLNELCRGRHKLGWNPTYDDARLREFTGDMGITYYTNEKFLKISDLLSLLNRRDILADFTSTSSVALQWAGPETEGIGIWNFLWQIIISKELSMRIEKSEGGSYSGFTPRVLASLTVSSLWLSNVEIILADAKIRIEDIQKPLTAEEKSQAEDVKARANDAMRSNRYQKAVDLYTEAMKIDLSNPIYRANRSAALLTMGKVEEAHHDALVTTQLDSKYAKGWARLGITELKLGKGMRAKAAYQRAIEAAGSEATALMKQGLADATALIDRDLKAIDAETDVAAQQILRNNFLDQEWEITGKNPEFHSRVHEQQVGGLLLFAERIKWPYINEVRDFAEDVYANLRSGATIPPDLYDWLFGLTLPGKWMSFKIMSALICSTPSLFENVGVARYYECGLSLPRQSYWRVRSVLGRVLGCVPGIISLCGWIGPCPPVDFIPPLQKSPRHVRLKARHVALTQCDNSDSNIIYIGGRGDQDDLRKIQPGEDVQDFIVQMKDSDNWIIPEAPMQEVSTVIIKAIRLKKLPLEVNIAAMSANGELDEKRLADESEYRATIVFSIDNNEDPVSYTLYSNPVFVTLPPCHLGPAGRHEIHLRELSHFQKRVWSVERLKDHTPEDFDQGVMIINATGKGAEAIARAWCSERGKNAVIRRAGGPCFACAVRGAGQAGLRVGVLIWVS
ncbi:prion-inhibition and propagation-domain-containing protein [Mycena metata]|uniref:Prion-inhibition and propagation-domain-containing protein n=1 Tax=Mycena metata TaxID=1033252 RepID=A0AAD7IRZ9_9AGAR|nr:prion-inhibition and propagation-domain-containing protein [Mycena metata]